MLTFFCIAATVIFALLALVWNAEGGLNTLIKVIMIAMTMLGLACSLSQLGYHT
jgi:hypothetical protein